MERLDKAVAMYIIKAQLCSDAGKNYSLGSNRPMNKRASRKGYSRKDFFIEKAIEKISQMKGKSGFSFWIDTIYESDGEIEIVYQTIVYFNFNLYGERRQVSFHSFSTFDKYRLSKYNAQHRTRWDKNIGGSRDACADLYNYIQMYVTDKRQWQHLYGWRGGDIC